MICCDFIGYDKETKNSKCECNIKNEISLSNIKIDKDILYDKFVNLEKCCEYFKLKTNKNSYHNALFDAFMTARLIDKLYELIEGNQLLKKKLYFGQKFIDNYLMGKNNLLNNYNKNNNFILNNKRINNNKKLIKINNNNENITNNRNRINNNN